MIVVNSVLFEDEITNKKEDHFKEAEVNESIGRGLMLRHGRAGLLRQTSAHINLTDLAPI